MAHARSTLIYAKSGDTKTSQLYHVARYIHKKTGKKLRLITGDGGDYVAFTDPSGDPFFKGKSLVEAGAVEVFDIKARKLALADMRRLSEGYWPRKIACKCCKGGLHLRSDEQCMTTPDEWKGIAGYLIEGLTSICTMWLNHMRKQQEGPGFKHSFRYEEDGYSIGGLQE